MICGEWRHYKHMKREAVHKRHMRPWLLRGVVLGCMLAVHYALVTAILSSGRNPVGGRAHSALQVRFVKISKASISPLNGTPGQAKSRMSPFPIKQSLFMPSVAPDTRKGIVTPTAEHLVSVLPTAVERSPAYVPGGRLLMGGDQMKLTRSPLPGAKKFDGLPSFPMVEPKTQGLATDVIRTIGSLTGAVAPECVNLDVWQGMSQEERIEHHIPDADLETARQSTRCLPPRQIPSGKR